MNDLTITDELVEALARQLRLDGWQKTSHTLTWDNAYSATRYRYRRDIRRALQRACEAVSEGALS